jgi:hypothetical protein
LLKHRSNKKLFLAAVHELYLRKQDISFALPLFKEMSQNSHIETNRLGWSGLKLFFPHEFSHANGELLKLEKVSLNG